MLFDTHTNLMWYPEHLSDEFVGSPREAFTFITLIITPRGKICNLTGLIP